MCLYVIFVETILVWSVYLYFLLSSTYIFYNDVLEICRVEVLRREETSYWLYWSTLGLFFLYIQLPGIVYYESVFFNSDI